MLYNSFLELGITRFVPRIANHCPTIIRSIYIRIISLSVRNPRLLLSRGKKGVLLTPTLLRATPTPQRATERLTLLRRSQIRKKQGSFLYEGFVTNISTDDSDTGQKCSKKSRSEASGHQPNQEQLIGSAEAQMVSFVSQKMGIQSGRSRSNLPIDFSINLDNLGE